MYNENIEWVNLYELEMNVLIGLKATF